MVPAGPGRAVALALVVLAPLAYVPGGLTRFGTAPLLLVCLAALVALAVPARGVLPGAVVAAGLVVVAAIVLASLAGPTPVVSLVGRWPRYEGLPLLLLLGVAGWLGARLAGPGGTPDDDVSENDVPDGVVVRVLAVLGVALAVLAVLDLAGWHAPGTTGVGRGGSVLGSATDQAAVALLAGTAVAGRALRDRDPWALVGLAGCLLTVAASGSRAAAALALVALLVVAVLARARAATWAATGVAAGLLVATALAVPVTRDRLLEAGTGYARLDQWRLTWGLVADHPLLGSGPGRYVDVFPVHEDAAFVRFTGPQELADSPHSLVLQLLVAGGVTLLLVAVAALVVVVLAARSTLRRRPGLAPVGVALVAYLLLLLLNPTAPAPACLAGFLTGLLVARPPGENARRPVRVLGAAVLASTALVLAAACAGDVALARAVDAADDDPVRALAELDRAHDLRPWDADLDALVAPALAEAATLPGTRRLDTVEACLLVTGRAVDRLPEAHDALVSSGVCRSVAGRPDEALAILDRAVTLAPRRPDGLVQRAIARAATGDLEGAVADARAAVRVSPGWPPARRVLRGLTRSVHG